MSIQLSTAKAELNIDKAFIFHSDPCVKFKKLTRWVTGLRVEEERCQVVPWSQRCVTLPLI